MSAVKADRSDGSYPLSKNRRPPDGVPNGDFSSAEDYIFTLVRLPFRIACLSPADFLRLDR